MARRTNTKKYRPGKFRSTFQGPWGTHVWEFLNQKRNLAIMETATLGGFPPLELLDGKLAKRFGLHDWTNRRKQMVGDMVRQILLGTYWYTKGGTITIPHGLIFSHGMTYIHDADRLGKPPSEEVKKFWRSW